MENPLIKIGEICKIFSGGTPRRGIEGYYGGNIPWAKIGDIETAESGYLFSTKESITQEGLKSINNKIFQKNTIFLALYGSVGKTAIAGKEMATNQAILGLIPKNPEVLYFKYLKYWLDFSKSELIGLARGVALQNISATIVKEYPIPLPSIEEQHRIVKILDLAQSLIEKRKQAISYLDDYINSTFFNMFIQNSEEKNIPCLELEKLSLKITDGVHAKPHYEESGVPFISVKNITTTKLLFDDCKFVSLADHQKFTKRCKAEYNDILYTKVGATYGRACIVDTKSEFSLYVSVSLIKPNKDLVDPAYLKSVLNSSFVKRQADKSVKGAGVPDLHLIEIKNFLIPLPTMELQQKFAKSVLEVESLKQKMQTQLKEMEDNFQAELQRAFKGGRFLEMWNGFLESFRVKRE